MPRCTHPPDRTAILFTARDYISHDRFEVRRCGACGLAWTAPRPDGASKARYYPDAYFGDPTTRRFPSVVEAFQRALYQGRARTIERLAGGPGRVLDVGCGRGFLLDAFRRRGWEVAGTELDDRSAAHARQVLRIPVHVGDAGGWPWPESHFDAVVLWHVLEHLPDPEVALARAARLLRPGGVLAVGVPNFASPEARLARGGWFQLDVPRHVSHFTPAWLGSALGESGLDVRRWSFFAPEYDVFSLMQSALNAIGLRHNALYDLLRGRHAKVLTRRDGAVHAIASLALAAPMALLAVPATALLGAARRGSSMTAFAIRRGQPSG